MNPPSVPLLENMSDIESVKRNITVLANYLNNLESFLRDGEVDSSITITGVTEDKTFAVGDTLTTTQHFLGTIVGILQSKGLL